jgi:antitoxin YefM
MANHIPTRRTAPVDAVVNERDEVVITRTGHEPVVLDSVDDYIALQEAARLLQPPGTRHRLPVALDRRRSD